MIDPAIAKFLAALEETQYLAPDRLEAYQRRLLDRLLRHARSQTDFYADRLAPVFRADDSIDWDRWAEIPILTRAQAQENAAALKARELPPVAGEVHVGATSGSTGRAFQHSTNQLQRIASACANERLFTWHGLDPTLLAAFIRATSGAPYPDGRFSKGWRIGHPDSPGAELTVATPIDRQVEWLRRIRPGILATYPSNLHEIGRLTAPDRPLRLSAILTTGEAISPETRAAIRSDFGLDPLDQYGTEEIGHVAGTCPHSGLHHIASELVLIEIVDEDGRVVAPGREGRIVLTSFYNLAMPFIRYDVGDYGSLSPEPCGCGRTLPMLQSILGRARNVFRFIDGSRKWPLLLSSEIQRFVPHRQWQFVQTALDRVEFRYVPMAPDQVNDLPALTAYVREHLHPSVQTDALAVDRIERSPSGKFEDCVSLLDRPESGTTTPR